MNHWREGFEELREEIRNMRVQHAREMVALRNELAEHKRITEPSILQKVTELIKARDDDNEDVAGDTGVVRNPWG